MRKILHSLVAVLLLLGNSLFAQQKIITGVVTSPTDNTPLSGVTVKVRGSNTAVQTDANGKFSISAKTGDVLQFTYVGLEPVDVKVTNSTATVSVSMVNRDNSLEEVVVTAMDIKRNPRELGYSVQKLSGTEIAETQRENFLNSLQGRVAGVSITPTGGQAGASTNIVLRGFNSLALSNQPLFIIDGVIVDNQTLDENSNQGSGLGLASDRPNRNNDYTNRIADLNPSDIESITVLKGPEATALYGSQASAGAIVISTRKGRNADGKLSVTYDNSFRVQTIKRLPKTQSMYAPGTNGIADAVFSYFGPKYPDGTTIYDNVDKFFQTGFAQTHNLGLEFGKKDVSFRFSGSYFDQQSVVPNNRYKKLNLRLSNYTKIGKYIEITPAFSIISSNNDKPLRGAGGYMLSLYQWPSNNDISSYLDNSGNKVQVYPGGDPNAEIDNPLFNVNFNRSRDELTRYIATAGININPFDWLSIAGRFGYDWYDQDGYTFYHPQSAYYSASTNGYLDNYYRKYKGYNHTINATAKKSFGNFNTRLMVGTMWQDYRTDMVAVSGSKLADVNSRDSSNTDPSTRVRLSRQSLYGDANYVIYRQFAYFGELALNWKNIIFLNYTHRFEEPSTLPKVNRSFNYPGGSLSIIFSDLIPALKNSTVLDYGKIRTSLASTARSNSPYSNQSVFNVANSSGGGFTYGFTNNNFNLGPERQNTYEIGTELRFLNNLFSIDMAYYNTKNTDQIVENFRASYGTGFILNTLNAASTRNQGVEAVININPVRKKDWRWTMTFNFAKGWNEVLSLPANVPEFYIADTWLYGNARGGLVKGGPTTSITAYGFQRNDAGQILINPTTGLPLSDGQFKIRGDRNPDFTLGFNNNLRYKNWSLNMLWDLKSGGDIYNGTERFLTLIGKSVRTLDRDQPVVIQGVLKDGFENSATPTANNIAVIPMLRSDFYTSLPEEQFIEKDISWLRLRDITLSYYFDKQKLSSKFKFLKSLSAFVTANDLILFTNYSGADPAVNGNTPGSRGVGGFGFDYGNIATPVSINFGFRAGF
ncbi:MAG: SusC/RagA family TonB-linked outer membrane protein [Terrimonas sp.]|nr:SusC/RagA family TonB-linked outer membrane protein [Terrimonas sp.]